MNERVNIPIRPTGWGVSSVHKKVDFRVNVKSKEAENHRVNQISSSLVQPSFNVLANQIVPSEPKSLQRSQVLKYESKKSRQLRSSFPTEGSISSITDNEKSEKVVLDSYLASIKRCDNIEDATKEKVKKSKEAGNTTKSNNLQRGQLQSQGNVLANGDVQDDAFSQLLVIGGSSWNHSTQVKESFSERKGDNEKSVDDAPLVEQLISSEAAPKKLLLLLPAQETQYLDGDDSSALLKHHLQLYQNPSNETKPKRSLFISPRANNLPAVEAEKPTSILPIATSNDTPSFYNDIVYEILLLSRITAKDTIDLVVTQFELKIPPDGLKKQISESEEVVRPSEDLCAAIIHMVNDVDG